MSGKIERVELLLLRLPYVHFFETSLGREEEREFILVKVYGDGICGHGEIVAGRSPHYSYETTSTAWHVIKDFLAPLVLDGPISSPLVFHEKAKEYRGHLMAKAGLELALWDIKGKREGVPLWKLYGGVKREIPSGVSIGIQDSVSELLDRVQSFIEEGYQRVKIKIKPAWDVGVIEEIRKTFPKASLQVDANGAYSLEDKDILKGLDEFNLLMKTPLCLDESILSVETARKAHEMKSCRIINIKVGRVGGIIESKKIHDFCQEKHIPVWCGGMLESGIGRAHNIHLATLPNFKFPNDLSASKRYYEKDLIDPPVEVSRKGTIQVPELPGIGVSILEHRIERATLNREVLIAS
jgi:O-succinylbenzoate synthase